NRWGRWGGTTGCSAAEKSWSRQCRHHRRLRVLSLASPRGEAEEHSRNGMIIPPTSGNAKISRREIRYTDVRTVLGPAKRADLIKHLDEIPRGTKVVIWARVSGHTQQQRGNLDDQEARVRRAAEAMSVDVVGVEVCVGPGWDSGISFAARKARE